MKTQRVVDLLQALVPNTFKAVKDALSMNPIAEGVDMPVCYVHPWKETAAPNSLDTVVRQNITEQFAVITLCPIADLETLRQALFDALLGRVLPTYSYDIHYVEGQVLDVTATGISWRDIYQTQRDRRNT